MRVIAGKARRIPLVTVKGMETRPTTDRTKETLFNMIAHGLCDCTFLDLFSGSGAIGIEAISRGVKKAVFVENNPNAIQCIMENLKKTQLEDQALSEKRIQCRYLRRRRQRTGRFVPKSPVQKTCSDADVHCYYRQTAPAAERLCIRCLREALTSG